jgi:hypothetical protein
MAFFVGFGAMLVFDFWLFFVMGLGAFWLFA